MKHFKYKHLAGLLAVILIACAMVALGAPVATGVAMVCLWQFSAFVMSKRRAVCYTGALTAEQTKEFGEILSGMKGYEGMFKELADLAKVDGGFAAIKQLPELLKSEKNRGDELEKALKKVQKRLAAAQGEGQVRYVGNVAFVTDECARALTATFVMECVRMRDGNPLARITPNAGTRERVVQLSAEILGMEIKAAMTTTELPLPIQYVPQITELVFKYGQARQFATVFPLGPGSTKLPRLKAGEDDFGFLGTGMAAGMSQNVGEKKAATELVTLDPSKAGGIIRLPTELEENTFVQVGQFLARYIARQFAKLEDKSMFIGDGTSTYAGILGVGPYCAANTDYLLQLGAGKTKPSDMTVDDIRNLRAKVSPAILAGGFDAAYYFNASFEPFLRSLNKDRNNLLFTNENGKPMFEGWPVRWLGVGQPYATTAAASTYVSYFGSLPYWYLGDRGNMRIELSKEVFFATDELALRAIEQIDIDALAVDAMASLQTAAA